MNQEIDKAATELPQFGQHCTIEQKRYGCNNEHYDHKIMIK